jgi:hypothetical protein
MRRLTMALIALGALACGPSVFVESEPDAGAGSCVPDASVSDAGEPILECSSREECPADEPCLLWRCSPAGTCVGVPTETPDCQK